MINCNCKRRHWSEHEEKCVFFNDFSGVTNEDR